VFSWIVYQSREDRDRINAAVMSDSRLKMDRRLCRSTASVSFGVASRFSSRFEHIARRRRRFAAAITI
jgi:uncharacterized protein YbaA (DUF1428 family)